MVKLISRTMQLDNTDADSSKRPSFTSKTLNSNEAYRSTFDPFLQHELGGDKARLIFWIDYDPENCLNGVSHYAG